MESRKEILSAMNTLHDVIKDSRIFSQGYIIRDGFPFTCVVSPANVYDAILVKPKGQRSFSPRYPVQLEYTVKDYIAFINKHRLEKAVIINDSIDFLADCPTLRFVEIIPSNSAGDGFDYSPLTRCPELKHVHCYTNYGPHFSNHTTVTYSDQRIASLCLYEGGHLHADRVQGVQKLALFENKEKQLAGLPLTDTLEILDITNCSFRSLDGLEKTSNLRDVRLYYNRTLSDISALRHAKDSLVRLIIENCPRITDMSILPEFEQLQELFLLGSKPVPNLQFLRQMKNLKVFFFSVPVEDNDLTPCLNIPHVRCRQNRRGYNLKDEDLPKGEIRLDQAFEGLEEWMWKDL